MDGMGATNCQGVRIMLGSMLYRIWYIMIGELEAQFHLPKTQASRSRRSFIAPDPKLDGTQVHHENAENTG